jgi:hypothetical protein
MDNLILDAFRNVNYKWEDCTYKILRAFNKERDHHGELRVDKTVRQCQNLGNAGRTSAD